ncbi:nuclear transport factor 2 family protein [Roseivirga sp. E12]|uniref:nuclear transport factor 2 family protein n=1 Tax=Roseivirga sp. E12 TaxID=2819237 RepID=UPI001ABC6117|nr:nuclear transport factor 2 family protein [Roseivirga sp. E12]MBO3697442.1 nuclear transport factor 2 family protein [Roseivirga sp. E12]
MKELIDKFYTAFANLDAEVMASCYHTNIVFYDPGFGTLKGKRASNMWRMLCSNQKGKGLKVTHSNVMADATKGSAHWEAHYTFSKTGRKVHNIIDAEFEFKDGLIIKHTDTFNLHRWSGQALGFQGQLLGWTGFFKKKLQAQTNRLLDKFESQR